jgi:hypothetical protein
MTRTLAAAVLIGLIAGTAAIAQTAGVAGNWRHQGSQTELVMRSVLRHQPYTMPGGFSTGGSVGPGSVTSSNIVMESVPMTVTRTMQLTVEPNGSFRWVTTKRQPASGQNCTTTIDQDRTGQLTTSGSQMSFNITGGTERTRNSCTGQTSSSAASRRTETYQYRLTGGALSLTAGGATWAFRR